MWGSAHLAHPKAQDLSKTIKHRHIFISGIDGVIEGTVSMFHCQLCRKQQHLDDSEEDPKIVKGPLKWIKESLPYQDFEAKRGFQRMLSGSVQPLVDSNWERGVYSSAAPSASTTTPAFSTTSPTFSAEVKE
jgi:hypothetical protein